MFDRVPLLLLLFLLLLAGCGGQSPSRLDPNGGPEPGPADPTGLDCTEMGFACTPGEVSPEVMERSDELLAEGARRLSDGETVADVAAWLGEQERMRLVLPVRAGRGAPVHAV